MLTAPYQTNVNYFLHQPPPTESGMSSRSTGSDQTSAEAVPTPRLTKCRSVPPVQTGAAARPLPAACENPLHASYPSLEPFLLIEEECFQSYLPARLKVVIHSAGFQIALRSVFVLCFQAVRDVGP